MLIVLLDEPGVFVFASPDDAAQYIEPIDAESEIRAAFDESGVPYKVEWIYPNRRSRWCFWGVHLVEPGEYRFVPAGPADRVGLIRLLETHSDYTTPPEAKVEMESLLAELRSL